METKANPIDQIVQAQKRGEARGIPSICSAQAWVLRAAMQQAAAGETPLLLEATCNQVNQFGGYTGMTPAGFVGFVDEIARQCHFRKDRLILGGDHLGPSPWQGEPGMSAMPKAVEMVRAFVSAGFVKIHLDASMRLGDDPPGPLDPRVSSVRTAELAQAAEQAGEEAGIQPRYVIGSEVPVPGGAKEKEGHLEITPVPRLRQTLDLTREAFAAIGLEPAWERVRAVVVQPGVEFGGDFVHPFDPGAAGELTAFIRSQSNLVYEAHSTDYQSAEALQGLVNGGFAILKVGPALTYAFREAVFALASIEDELTPPGDRSHIVDELEEAMVRRPEHWQGYYHGDEEALRLARQFNRSDRIRYYWGDPRVQAALDRLLLNLQGGSLPAGLVSRILPGQGERIRSGQALNSPEAIILDRIDSVLEMYALACGSR
jgi:D-tagatose-1,6-bisphosphate aldolase subunit GatZ/KbaZ